MKIAVIQHHMAEGPGRITQWAALRGIKLKCFYAPAVLPLSLTEFDGVVILGGPMDVADAPDWMQRERVLIKDILLKQTPLLTICLGAQLLAVELGATLFDLKEPELGWHQATIQHGMTLTVPQWHYKGFLFSTSQSDVAVLAKSTQCPQQIFKAHQCVGLQFHPEWCDAQLAEMQKAFGDECPFVLPSNEQSQQLLEHWFFELLDDLFDAKLKERL